MRLGSDIPIEPTSVQGETEQLSPEEDIFQQYLEWCEATGTDAIAENFEDVEISQLEDGSFSISDGTEEMTWAPSGADAGSPETGGGV